MRPSITQIVDSYDADAPLERASTIPAAWYVSPDVMDLERRSVFAQSWHVAGRAEQVDAPGRYVSCVLPSGEPIVVVRGRDGVLRGFFNVCRHHAAAVIGNEEGEAEHLRCPYHGWTYSLEGELKGTPDFAGACEFDQSAHGLVPVEVDAWETWIFVKTDPGGPSLQDFLGPGLMNGVAALGLAELVWLERRRYLVECNWKVFVDNYLDGGYHVPSVHEGLNSVLDYSHYTIELGERWCLQSSPIEAAGADARTAAVRQGDRAHYYWLYPNFMINCYQGRMDTNLVVPLGIDKTEVVFDFYSSDVSEAGRAQNLASIEVSEHIQHEDVAICLSVQRGLGSRSYTAGRLSVRREAGEHLFHRLLARDFKSYLKRPT
jgi:choline monooxygenase